MASVCQASVVLASHDELNERKIEMYGSYFNLQYSVVDSGVKTSCS